MSWLTNWTNQSTPSTQLLNTSITQLRSTVYVEPWWQGDGKQHVFAITLPPLTATHDGKVMANIPMMAK